MRWTWEGCLNLLACTFLRKTGQDYRGGKCPLGGFADSIGGRIRVEDVDAEREVGISLPVRANSGYALALIGYFSTLMNEGVSSPIVHSPCFMVRPTKRPWAQRDDG